jgi:hypothetical protein
MFFVRRHRDRNAALVREPVALRLVPMVMSVQNAVDLSDAEAGEVVQYFARAKIYQQAMLAIADEIHIAGVGKLIQIL